MLEAPGFLVLSDAFSPGWQASLNGQTIDIHQVNGGVRGVFVPTGNHQLIFNYLPQSFVLGAKISLASLLLLLAVYIFKKP